MNPPRPDDLLRLNAQLKETLGDSYGTAWIEAGRLHVTVTDDAAAKQALAAGAEPHRAAFNAQRLDTALQDVLAWAGRQNPPVQLHRAGLNPRTESVELRVAPADVDTVQAAAAWDDPGRGVPVHVMPSAGLARPYRPEAP